MACGFADGFSRQNSLKDAWVGIRGKRCPIAGKVCMDMMMVRVGPLAQMSKKDIPHVGELRKKFMKKIIQNRFQIFLQCPKS